MEERRSFGVKLTGTERRLIGEDGAQVGLTFSGYMRNLALAAHRRPRQAPTLVVSGPRGRREKLQLTSGATP